MFGGGPRHQIVWPRQRRVALPEAAIHGRIVRGVPLAVGIVRGSWNSCLDVSFVVGVIGAVDFVGRLRVDRREVNCIRPCLLIKPLGILARYRAC